MKQTLELLSQIEDMAKAQARQLDDYNILRHKALLTIGTNPVVHHLALLRELILLESGTHSSDTVQIDDKTFQVAFGDEPPASQSA